MRILITSSRMPFALDGIRKLGESGHKVFACDSYAASPGSHSRYLAGHFTTASPSGDPERFAADIERIAGENGIEVVLPMFEEVFYLAAQHERISAVTRLYAPPFRTLAKVHDKGTFQELCDRLEIRTPHTVLCHDPDALREGIERFPRYFARAAFSRGGVGLLTNTGPLAGHLSPNDCRPTEANPWLVQEFVDGPMHCTCSALHGGRVASHMSYRSPRQWEHSTGIQFLSVGPTDTLPTVEVLGRELDWDGQMSLDFIETDEGLVMIECNPRPTDGVLLMTAEELERGLLAPEEETLLGPPAGARSSISRCWRSSSRSRCRRRRGRSTIWRGSMAPIGVGTMRCRTSTPSSRWRASSGSACGSASSSSSRCPTGSPGTARRSPACRRRTPPTWRS
jgi:hypothetical protein